MSRAQGGEMYAVKEPKGGHLESQGADGSITLQLIIQKQDWMA